MIPAKKNFIEIFLLLLAQYTFAQDTNPSLQVSGNNKENTSFTVSSNYSSNLHYFGRTDSLKSAALIPNILLQFGNGLFFSSSAIFITNKQQPLMYTATIAGVGYNFGKPKRIGGTIYADKFFFANHTLVQSSQLGQAGFKLSHQNNILGIELGASTVFSNQSDYFAALGLDHIFLVKQKNTVFVIMPSFTANAGTQNFTHSYYKTRNIFGIPAGEELVTQSSKRFQCLSYEASVPVIFVYKKFIASFTPGYVIPQSIIKVAGRPDLSENATNLFYANVGIGFKFGQ